MGDFNAQIGSNNNGFEHIMGKHALGNLNSNGELFLELCNSFDLAIGGSLFIHKNSHKTTWLSPDSKTENQIDHICISRKWRKCLLDVRVKRSADIGSDHQLVNASIKLKVASAKKYHKPCQKRFNIGKLKDGNTKSVFQKALSEIEIPYEFQHSIINHKWEHVKSSLINICESTLGFKPPNRKPWMSESTWCLIEERRRAKKMRDQAKSLNDKQQAAKNYNQLIKTVQKACRQDKRNWINGLAHEAEQAAQAQNTRMLYEITRKISGARQKTTRAIRAKDGSLLTTDDEQLQRWREHFGEILNQQNVSPGPLLGSLSHNSSSSVKISSSPPSKQEILAAIKALKNNKAAGCDGLPAEIFKACPEQTANLLQPVFNAIWDEEELPDDWLQGILVVLPKKGDLSLCKNYRGIMLLSVASKILSSVLLNRIKTTIDSSLGKQQAGFRSNRSCVDQINTLRIIVEQVQEWQTTLQLTFVDYSTAFDCVSRNSIWDALHARRIPAKLISLVRAHYNNFKCRILHNGKLSESIPTSAGVRQGCLLSPLLFLIVIDDILKSCIEGKRRGIYWNFHEHLEDLAYADDICLLSVKHTDMQNKIDDLFSTSSNAGLKINHEKTKTMKIRSTNSCPFFLNDEQIENVETFTYLGSIIAAEDSAKLDVIARINKANGAYAQLRSIWSSSFLSVHTKLRIFKSNVLSVLLYGSETWPTNNWIENKIQSGVNRCLRRILKIWWPNIISNDDLYERCKIQPVVNMIKLRKWRWIGHTLRKDANEICRQALDWNPQGARKVGRPKLSWRRTVQKEVETSGKTWNEIKLLAKNRTRWKCFTEALCSSGRSRNR